jgi:molybdopterin-containing oxidoreductase family iron-sulfur binding subunit
MSDRAKKNDNKSELTRRKFLAGLAAGTAALTLPVRDSNGYIVEEYFRQHFKRLDKDDLKKIFADLEDELAFKYGKKVTLKATPPMDNVVFGYALDLSRCVGCRRCVYACVKENNLSRNPGRGSSILTATITPRWFRKRGVSMSRFSASSAKTLPA